MPEWNEKKHRRILKRTRSDETGCRYRKKEMENRSERLKKLFHARFLSIGDYCRFIRDYVLMTILFDVCWKENDWKFMISYVRNVLKYLSWVLTGRKFVVFTRVVENVSIFFSEVRDGVKKYRGFAISATQILGQRYVKTSITVYLWNGNKNPSTKKALSTRGAGRRSFSMLSTKFGQFNRFLQFTHQTI